jgi:hypothetical protein
MAWTGVVSGDMNRFVSNGVAAWSLESRVDCQVHIDLKPSR